MTYGDFPKYAYVKSIDTGENPLLGGYKHPYSMELKHISLYIFIDHGLPTLETMKLEIHRNNACTAKAFESNTIRLSDIPNLAARWKGWIRFDFNRQNINKNFFYYPKLILSNYTRTDTALVPGYYIGIEYDWPMQTNVNASSNPVLRPLKAEWRGYI